MSTTKPCAVYLHPWMQHTIFQRGITRRAVEEGGVVFVNNLANADVAIASRVALLSHLIRWKKRGSQTKFVLWTHEPRFWTDARREAWLHSVKIRIFSVYTGEVFQNNYYYADTNRAGLNPQPIEHMRPRRAVCVATRRSSSMSLVINGAQVDLYDLRSRLALFGHERGMMDIYGAGWPKGISRGKTVGAERVREKYQIFPAYAFNLCFENTLWPHYCTEKIWQSIYGGCLPIYHGQPSIYEDFPEESFIDYSQLGSPQALFDLLAAMPGKEYAHRYNRCLEAFQRARPKAEAARLQAARYAAEVIRGL